MILVSLLIILQFSSNIVSVSVQIHWIEIKLFEHIIFWAVNKRQHVWKHPGNKGMEPVLKLPSVKDQKSTALNVFMSSSNNPNEGVCDKIVVRFKCTLIHIYPTQQLSQELVFPTQTLSANSPVCTRYATGIGHCHILSFLNVSFASDPAHFVSDWVP